MSRSMQIAAAVAVALGVSGAALAAPPSLSAAASAPITLFVAGSSAAKNGILAALQTNLCGGASNALTLSSGNTNTNFFAVSCTVAASSGLSFAGQIATVYYRDEGGSVVGALPIITGKSINQLNLADTADIPGCGAGSTACAPNVGGSSASNGTNDSFTGAVIKKPVQLGITDLEPAVFIGANDNYPSAYSTAIYGSATAAQMSALSATSQPLFQQVFGLFVNVNSAAFGTPKPTSLSISKAALTNILQGAVGDWSQVSDTSGNPIANTSLAINLVNRESGSGSRAGASIYFTGDECSPTAVTLADPAGAGGDFFSTGNVLTAANATAGSITYASIDNASATNANLVLVNIDGVAPNNLNAATGQYDYWFEATAVPSPSLSGNTAVLANWLIGELQTQATAPHLVDVNAIPLLSTNNPALPVASTANTLSTGGVPIYVNQFTRSGSSCNTPSDDL